ncbi:MAG: DEAD/DEAH box helicase family protein [Kiritimatiellia bacterium]
MVKNDERQFESDIEAVMTGELGWMKSSERGYLKWRDKAMDLERLVDFVKATQPKAWLAFERSCGGLDVYNKFYRKFQDEVASVGLLDVLRNGFHANGKLFRAIAFRPENRLNDQARADYGRNICQFVRQWHYSEKEPAKSVDIVLMVNGLPLAAIELKDQNRGQTVENAKAQWARQRDPRELCFRLNRRVLVFFAVDLNNVYMTTELKGEKTFFLPFNQGTNGPGNDGGAGNPAWRGKGAGPLAPTDYLWHDVLQKDSFLDILQKFVNYDREAKRIVFPRYHQLDVVRRIVEDVRANGSGRSYLVQHSAGSGKSNSIAWIAYRLASLFDTTDRPVFNSVIIVTDRRVLDKQLQGTVMSFNPQLGEVAVIDEDKTSRDLLAAINGGRRIIVSTLQKFPVIFRDVKSVEGRRFAVIVDEAHSSQTGDSAAKMKYALADLKDAIIAYEEETGKTIDRADLDNPDTQLALLMCAHGRHPNLSYFAFTATPKDVTLDMFGTRRKDGTFRPFHTYSMRQAIEEGFIHDVLANYMTYQRCTKIIKAIAGNPEVPVSETAKTIQKYKNLHPKNFLEKSEVIVDTFLGVTEKKYPGAKMMVVTGSRLEAVRYFRYIREALKARNRADALVMVAFSGAVEDPPKSGTLFTEESMNRTKAGKTVKETQTKAVFHEEGSILIVAEKYQTGFDEPLLHTMVVDKRLHDVKAVQTLSRVNRIHPDKNDTFILDFANTDEEIREAFQPFYHQTELADEINVDLVFAKLREIRAFGVYSSADVERVCAIHFTGTGKSADASTQGQIAGALVDVQRKYNALDPKKRALYRRQVRAFIRWYNYLCQITRLFDEETQREHIFLSYLVHLLPSDPVETFDLADSVALQYYKLKQTFAGKIALDGKNGVYETPQPKEPSVMEQKKDRLQAVIDQINEQYTGDFTEKDRVIMEMVIPLLFQSKKLQSTAISQDEKVYDGVANKEIENAILEAHQGNDEAFKALLEDKEKLEAFKMALAKYTFGELRARAKDGRTENVPVKSAEREARTSTKDCAAADGLIHAFTVKPMMGWLIMHGVKDVENRSKGVNPPKGTCAVSYSKGYTPDEYEGDIAYLRDEIGLDARKIKSLPSYEELKPFCGKVVGVVDYEVAEGSSSRWYYPGCKAWKMSRPRQIAKPFPVRGFVNMWNLEPADAKKILAQL